MSNLIPTVNNYRMGITRSYQGVTDGEIDTPGERLTSRKFDGVKDAEQSLASDLVSLDNTVWDSDPRRGSVLQVRDGFETGTGNYVSDRTRLKFDRATGAPISLSSRGEYTTSFGTISATKDVEWDDSGHATGIDENRTYRDGTGWTIGKESVTASESSEGLSYRQDRSGYLFGQ